MSAHARAFSSSASRSARTDGIRRSEISVATATCSAVGNVSLDDWLRLTSSLGWIGFLPPRVPVAASLARPAITSFTFMFDCVPEPVCQTRSGNSLSSAPAATSSAAATISAWRSSGSTPRSWFTSAAARFSTPNARTMGRGIVSRPTRKKCSERWVWAAQ